MPNQLSEVEVFQAIITYFENRVAYYPTATQKIVAKLAKAANNNDYATLYPLVEERIASMKKGGVPVPFEDSWNGLVNSK